MALANQAKVTPTKHNEIIEGDNDTSMSTDEYNSTHNELKPRTKSTREKSTKSMSSKASKKLVEPIHYGPIVVKPRRSNAPTLANGRKSKDEPVCIIFSF